MSGETRVALYKGNVIVEGRRADIKQLWAPIAANLAVGVSLGLPLFLYIREVRIERSARTSARSA